ncbi:META domain-containing protein [Flagellimonas algicola]|uniref:META domain-containing protein n=1 Tax=Flagellimonas algicola TaxID=2583815 RepID=A0ABY2WJ94_9FLAO|nr:META domain-containing protein [Allomuricauda algicola]TMU54912.1 META domain-containing protein [Allomuricauda algicola]
MDVGLRRCIFAFLCIALITCTGDDVDVDNQKIIGEWQVVAIYNSSPSGPTLGPLAGEIISIIFFKNGTFEGTTSANTFGGEFSASDTHLVIEEMITTEVADTVFGQAFYETFEESRSTDTGFSEFELSFQEGSRLHLEYQSFKFLGLQKQ